MTDSRRVVYAVIACTFFVGFGGGVVFPILPNLGAVLGISPFLVGLILSANRITRLVANAPAGALVDRAGTRTPFVVGLFVEGVATLGYVVAVTAPLPEVWFLLSRVCWGVGSALVFATAYTITADVSDAGSRGTSMGVVRAGITFGFPAGLVLGGVVSEAASVAAAFVLAAGFALFASVLAYRIVPETHVDADDAGDDSIKPWEIDPSISTLTVGLVNFGLFFAYVGALFSTLVLFLEARSFGLFGFDAQGTSGALMAVTVLSGSVAMLAGGTLSDRHGYRVPIVLGSLAVSGVGFLLLPTPGGVGGLVAACVLIGAGQGGTTGPMMALIADLTPDERMGRAMGTNNVLGDVGGALGPLVSLPLVETVGFAPVYVACALIPVVAGVVLVVGVRAETGAINPSLDSRAGD
ncbi:Predicted arabinose efflux permease, MFS family [Natronoarchaeum philippinense]|uniref:Predicted arabinose efflux permease, MFS family n=1 Tax=Natronoarchaeum philippinense TaxID=558529 RepID=A0A285N5Q6_NATPI|nr:MFS transporter [Natronoarchaeum philippinense]SNZ04658.1 Predicted arabinose efflux permease, MFS family [Natronoarchaeum philippinense]